MMTKHEKLAKEVDFDVQEALREDDCPVIQSLADARDVADDIETYLLASFEFTDDEKRILLETITDVVVDTIETETGETLK